MLLFHCILKSSKSSKKMTADRVNALLFPDGNVLPVKTAGSFVFARNPSDSKMYVLLGQLSKTNPFKPETHIFDKTYSGFSGKSKSGESPVETAVRELCEEVGDTFGTPEDVLNIITGDKTHVVKNMGWSKYPVATYFVDVEFSQSYIDKFQLWFEGSNDPKEITCLKWIDVQSIWDSMDKYMIDGLTWAEYNSAKHLGALYTPLNSVFSGVELELEKNKFKQHLPVSTYDGKRVMIADYIARTLMEYRHSEFFRQ